MVVADNHTYAVQPRPQHPDEVIVWEMDERTLPRRVIDGRGENSIHHGYALYTLHCGFCLPAQHCPALSLQSLSAYRFLHPNPFFLYIHSLSCSLHSPLHPSPSPHTFPPSPPLGVQCPIPIPPLDGHVSWSSGEVGATLHYYCREGFDLVGTASQECLPIGEWSSFTPLCKQGESMGGVKCGWIHLCHFACLYSSPLSVVAAPVMTLHCGA